MRERIEIESGGFGMGELRELYLDLQGDESEDERNMVHKDEDEIRLSDGLSKPKDLTV